MLFLLNIKSLYLCRKHDWYDHLFSLCSLCFTEQLEIAVMKQIKNINPNADLFFIVLSLFENVGNL